MKKRKIIIIGDSHARSSAMELSKYVGKDFEVTGTARLKYIIHLADKEISSLDKDDAVIIWRDQMILTRMKRILDLNT
jgi:hypothetical protein